MANCMMGFPNRTDTSVLSGGSWTTGLPLANLQKRVLGRVARSSDASLASTTFDTDLGQVKNVRALALANHNMTINASWRVRGSNDPTFSTSLFDAGWTAVWPVVFPYGVLEWEDDNWWSGKYTDEEILGYTTMVKCILPNIILARYWRIEIDDHTNSAGYVQAGRLFIGPAWQPIFNMSYGATLGWSTDTEVQKALSGTEYFAPVTPYRTEKFSIEYMAQDEAFSQAFEIQRRAGIDKEILWIHDPDDTAHSLRRSFIGRMNVLNPILFPQFNLNSTSFEVKESL